MPQKTRSFVRDIISDRNNVLNAINAVNTMKQELKYTKNYQIL